MSIVEKAYIFGEIIGLTVSLILLVVEIYLILKVLGINIPFNNPKNFHGISIFTGEQGSGMSISLSHYHIKKAYEEIHKGD